MEIVSCRHSRSALGYHFVFVTKRRRRVFFGRVEAALKRVLSEVSVGAGYGLELVGVDGDHVHLFVTAPADAPPSEVARRLKGASARRMRAISEGAVRRYVAAKGSPS